MPAFVVSATSPCGLLMVTRRTRRARRARVLSRSRVAAVRPRRRLVPFLVFAAAWRRPIELAAIMRDCSTRLTISASISAHTRRRLSSRRPLKLLPDMVVRVQPVNSISPPSPILHPVDVRRLLRRALPANATSPSHRLQPLSNFIALSRVYRAMRPTYCSRRRGARRRHRAEALARCTPATPPPGAAALDRQPPSPRPER